MDLRDTLERTATTSGLVGFGVCSADPFPEVADDLDERVSSGKSAGMHFTFGDPARSTDIRSSFPWAERLVVGAWGYLPKAGTPGPSQGGSGRIARFATEDHYVGLRSALQQIAAELTRQGHQAEVLVDDNRLVDRAAAVRAGVGWWGKNSMVLAPGAGPWLLLGSVATDATLEVSEPMTRDCGTCSACLPACPTGALVAPGVLDASRCLAYWAQAPGPVPIEFRSAMRDRFYGCDDCLDACPPGSRAIEAATDGVGRVDLVGVLSDDDESLLERFAHFYIPRRDPTYLRRNALIALGNSGGEDDVDSVLAYLDHPDWLLRAHAAWAAAQIGGPVANSALKRARHAESDPRVLAELG